jgi:hypothetical protein
MREIRLTDQELQKLVAPVLRGYLRRRGFVMGRSSAEFPTSLFVPISLDLVGWCNFERDADGVWTIQQDENRMADLMAEAREMHYAAIVNREAPRS